MCLLWAIPLRDLLPLLRLNPTLYHRAVQQAVPSMSFDYLKIVGVRSIAPTLPLTSPTFPVFTVLMDHPKCAWLPALCSQPFAVTRPHCICP